ncbi:outer-membrane lipoprotein carrier protein LolA [Oricola cellulosilytica]|uniref:Outer membrane lipoprotein carrier protein LolA n=1 Tax=Oricola cellulosilytica TaxID=1429082 RepID=A0A4R0PDP5_9HYPH|nr:outer membrane lipoprotein carrier protein LolA [Oricola cellulosilytica]TCD15895.1 outer membrane lipoprotein carrier protein LolA [Oricola cellulosilytica]
MTASNTEWRLTRRTVLAGVASAALAAGLPAIPANAASGAAQKIAEHFSRVKTMSGEFVQFGPSGESTGGKFYIQRPGKLLFLYEKPSPIRVVADGKTLLVNNTKLDTFDAYPLDKTPLKLLLGDRIDLGGNRVRRVNEADDLTTIVMGDKQVFGDSEITMMFDPATYDLRQWTIRDAQGKDTTVIVSNVREGVQFGPGTFDIPYHQIRERKTRSKSR